MNCRLVAIVVVTLGLSFSAWTQSKAPLAAKPAQDSQVYRNANFAFRYQIPYGWVNRTEAMRGEAVHDENAADRAEVLLAVFEHPPEATADTINSAVVIASESVASYPGLKNAEDYLSLLTELATSKGFKPEGAPYAIEVESRHLLRADFIKPLEVKTGGAQLTMRQCTLVLLAKGRIASFTFIAGSEDELDDLMDGLHFGLAKPSAH